ncbi:N-terminal C2 in EEIG1 and EHBP1 proteins family protein [Candida parapsilosis]|uniref:N-terminal C2 in EEIG1 and EHBP1 proteins family protein n=1 Tax=Candida parapsilosis TaxID=5480 RepID=A0A8X7NHR8_CANPA|nr:N-terminal C2 in EEIG1 and EHBP1 proteins family protein [Candida parapsilosis]KAF6042432.1 N-terminal C2 in EEIG1 and EHBP1 proteins family protein [Candida parapsilosis]KAF6042877.1 N-terminal C2 in EEIG1 and EHBP1 proteins family protein [Candida parapsilosis]KAF6058114.1 N-terminal C2 in EEIG1 and EHBP1 proteins family protein [Candida parapsilosis]KAI5903207.1 hypothetical protein K4G60_g2362 [Candida parapsilosis]
MFSSSKPKFALELSINELTNVPQINGACYIEVSIRDSKHKHMHKHTNGSRAPSKDTSSSTNSSSNGSTSASNAAKSFLNRLDSKASKTVNKEVAQAKGSSGHISTTTSLKKLHNFKCNFNYKLTCNLKFNLKSKKSRLIGNKYLSLRVYYVHDDRHGGDEQIIIPLGRLEINLAEYLNFEEPVNLKYLLDDSKVNSILNLTIGLSELPENFDFHTQLQIQDNNSSVVSSTALKEGLHQNKKRNTTFNVPQFERKNVFNGISNIFGDSNADENGSPNRVSAPSTPQSESDERPQSPTPRSHRSVFNQASSPESSASSKLSLDGKPIDDITNLNNQDLIKLVAQSSDVSSAMSTHSPNSNGQNGQNGQNGNGGGNHNGNSVSAGNRHIAMDPIINSLYTKILESNWDPALYPLLDYSPNQCIDDIFDNPENPYGCNLKLKDFYDSQVEKDEKNNGYRNLNGLINEDKYRSNLRSWTLPDSQ